MACRIIGNVFAWVAGVGVVATLAAISAHVKIFSMDGLSWTSTITTFLSGPLILAFAYFIQRNPKYQMLTWIPVPIALVAALWIIEGLESETLQEMLQAAFAATSIGVIFDATLLIGISLGLKKALWPVVVVFTIIASVAAYFAAGDVVAAFCIGVFAAAVNILNIPHITTPICQTSTSTPTDPQWIIIPLVWVLLGISVILQELKYYRLAGIISNAPCMHFVVAFMMWWTSTHAKKEDLTTAVLFMVDNIGIGSVAVFSSSVFTAIFWQGLTHHTGAWTIYGTAVGVALAVSVIMYFYTWVPSAKERIKVRKIVDGEAQGKIVKGEDEGTRF